MRKQRYSWWKRILKSERLIRIYCKLWPSNFNLIHMLPNKTFKLVVIIKTNRPSEKNIVSNWPPSGYYPVIVLQMSVFAPALYNRVLNFLRLNTWPSFDSTTWLKIWVNWLKIRIISYQIEIRIQSFEEIGSFGCNQIWTRITIKIPIHIINILFYHSYMELVEPYQVFFWIILRLSFVCFEIII